MMGVAVFSKVEAESTAATYSRARLLRRTGRAEKRHLVANGLLIFNSVQIKIVGRDNRLELIGTKYA